MLGVQKQELELNLEHIAKKVKLKNYKKKNLKDEINT